MATPIVNIAVVAINYECPVCGTIMSMGCDAHPLGTPFTCFCKREIVVNPDTVLKIKQLGLDVKLKAE